MLYNVEFLRVIFCIAILLCHASTGKFVVFHGTLVENHFIGGNFAVDFFFIIGGYFLFFQTIKKDLSIRNYIVKKWIRLAPTIIFSMLVVLAYRKFGLIFSKLDFRDNFLRLFFIRTLGLYREAANYDVPKTNTHLWYISPLFWTSVLYFSIAKTFDRRKANLLIAVITYISYIIVLNNVVLAEKSLILNSAFRSLPNVGLGYFVGVLVDQYRNVERENVESRKKSSRAKYSGMLSMAIITYVEGYFFVEIFKVMFIKPEPWEEEFYYLICFAVLLFLFSIKKGWLSRIMNQKIMGFCGKYCYSIYTTQYLVQILLAKGNRIGENKIYLNFVSAHPLADVLINYVMLEIIVGVVVYHLVEKPCAEYLERCLSGYMHKMKDESD
jgi:peptidoglycan/LPS O-acetylase OafA/YrhL